MVPAGIPSAWPGCRPSIQYESRGPKMEGVQSDTLGSGTDAERTMSDQDRPASGRAWPTEIKLRKDRRTLVVTFDNGEVHELAAEYLRVKSPSAEVQGHAPEERKT